jgi:hypothetical protein
MCAPTLPTLEDALITFFNATLNGWHQFTVEFTEGGLIDSMTPEEHEDCYIPMTNDSNEGHLGSLWVVKCNAPNLMGHAYNAWTMSKLNEMEGFMDTHFDEEHHSFIWMAARE